MAQLARKHLDGALRFARARLEVDRDALVIAFPDGRTRRAPLAGARSRVRDAALAQRFVRHLRIELVAADAGASSIDVITPPDQGAIAPRAARLPPAPQTAIVVDIRAWEAATAWITSGGRLCGLSIPDLARLSRVATSAFAITIGEHAARLADEITADDLGPMRCGVDLRWILRPFENAARESPRAAEALVAALAQCPPIP